jgi:SlyX protein
LAIDGKNKGLTMNEERIVNLEIKFSHQDHFLMQLNEVVMKQSKVIERLEKELIDLKSVMNASSQVDPNRTLADDRPPHY